MKDYLRDLVRRTRMMLARLVLDGVNDLTGLQTVQVRLLADETKGGVAHMQTYGFTMHPLPGAEGIGLFIEGNRDHGVVINLDDRRYRLRPLQPGEVAVYTFENLQEGGHRMVFKNGQNLDLFIGNDVLNEIGHDVDEHVGNDFTQTVGNNETIDVESIWQINIGEKGEINCGSSTIRILPDKIQLIADKVEVITA